ncbi:hypothetical protein Tco_0305411 [Tanacetum coccineum]
MWEAIERLQQGESLNIQDVKTNLFWEFGKFTSHDGETMESYYTRFYKMINEMIRNNLTVAMMQVNVQFLQQLHPEWSRIAKNANPLALVAAAQSYPDPYYQAPKKPKRVKDFTYHKEKMLVCKQAEKGIPLQADQSDWLVDTDKEIDDKNWKHIIALWQRSRRFLLQTQELILSHWNRNQSIQTIHMFAPKGPTLNGRPTFANPMYLKKAQSEKPCLYEIPYDKSDPANRLVPDAVVVQPRPSLYESEVKQLAIKLGDEYGFVIHPVTEDPPFLKPFLNGKHELLASVDIFPCPKSCVQTWIHPVDLEFLDPVVQCLINLLQIAVTELVESTQGTHRTTSAPMSPNPDVDAGESSAQRKSTIIRLRIPPRRSTRLTPPTPILTVAEAEDITLQEIIQLSIVEQKSRDDLEAKQNEEKVKEHLMAEEIEKLVEGTENVENNEVVNYVINNQEVPGTRRENGKEVEETRNTPPPTPTRSTRNYSTLISSDTEKLQELTITDPKPSSSTPSSSSPKPTLSMFLARNKFNVLAQHLQEVMEESLPKMVDARIKELTRTQVQLYVAHGVIMERQQSQADVAKMITDAIQQERQNLRTEISLQINNAITNRIPSHVDSSVRNYISSHILDVHSTQATLKIKFEGLQASNTSCKPFAIRPRDQDDPHDDAHPEGENSAKRQKTSEHGTYVFGESSSGQVNESEPVIKTYGELGHEHNFITKIIARRENGSIVSINEPDYKNLKKNDIEDMYLLIVNGKKVNLTAPTINFLGIEKHKMFSIVSEPVYGITYKNNKKEKRVMRHQEAHKFCDATLKRVLEGLKSYNNNVKHGYVTSSLSNEDIEYL